MCQQGRERNAGQPGWEPWRPLTPPAVPARGEAELLPGRDGVQAPGLRGPRAAAGVEGEAGRLAPSRATGRHRPGSWAPWGTRAGCSRRSCCTGPPEMAGSAKHLCSTPSAPSGSFRQPLDRSCAPAGVEGREAEESARVCGTRRPIRAAGDAFLKRITKVTECSLWKL